MLNAICPLLFSSLTGEAAQRQDALTCVYSSSSWVSLCMACTGSGFLSPSIDRGVMWPRFSALGTMPSRTEFSAE